MTENNGNGNLYNASDVAKNKQSFWLGLTIGISIISTLALCALLVYMFTQGTVAGNGSGKTKVTQYEQCLSSTEFNQKIDDSSASGAQYGVAGTPAVFINGYLIAGAYPVDYFKQVIDDLLAGKEPKQEFLQDENGKINKVDITLTSDDHVMGADDAKITLVEYSDFECPYCARVIPSIDQLMKDYEGQIKLVFRHFPLSFHANAKNGAIAAECAAKQGKFWEMYTKLFELNSAGSFNLDNIKKAGTDLGLK